MEDFYKGDKLTLLKFLEHEIVFEYEKAKDQLFDDNMQPQKKDAKEENEKVSLLASFETRRPQLFRALLEVVAK